MQNNKLNVGECEYIGDIDNNMFAETHWLKIKISGSSMFKVIVRYLSLMLLIKAKSGPNEF